jgi:periplasmic mercuric ion binding protein
MRLMQLNQNLDNMKLQLLTIALFAMIGTSWAQKTQTVVIHTSAECGQCEERLETGLNYTKGVIFAELDLETQNVTIKYSTKKTDVAKLKAAINEMGYDADDQKTTAAALEKLPECCRPNGMENKGGVHQE